MQGVEDSHSGTPVDEEDDPEKPLDETTVPPPDEEDGKEIPLDEADEMIPLDEVDEMIPLDERLPEELLEPKPPLEDAMPVLA
jgi:hypothetical protein